MIREKVVLRLMQRAQQLGVSSLLSTNGFWGKTLEGARRRLKAMRGAGLVRLTVSYDRYHAEFQGPQAAVNIAQAAEELDLVVHISITRVADDPELDEIVAPFQGMRSARLRFYDVQPVGSAREFSSESLRSEVGGFCSACDTPAITDDGRMTACNGPSYFSKASSPLLIGSLEESSVGSLARRHREDPILDTIRTFGPGRLRDELQQIAGFEDFPFRDQYFGMCELCHHLTGNPDAVEALRERLSDPKLVAERYAMQQLIEVNKRGGLLQRDYVNGIGACRVFLQATSSARSEPWGIESSKVLGRADVDWNHLLEYVGACGFAKPLQFALDDPQLSRWAPTFFVEQMKERALREAMRELLQRETMRKISSSLQELGEQGVLLKGSAMLARSDPDFDAGRSTGDIDIYVAPAVAQVLRRKLLDQGFEGSPDAPRSGPHHLGEVYYRGIPVEIHTRVMPTYWGLPETAMLEHAQPIKQAGFEQLQTLDGEGMFLHAAVHATAHLFSYGLKTAWDLRWVVETFSSLDWDRIAQWVSRSRIPRAFWVPVRTLCDELPLPVPFDFLSRAPLDQRQRKLELIARHRLFSVHEGSLELNPFSKNGTILLMHDSQLGRLRYLMSLLGKHARESRKRSAQVRSKEGATGLLQQLKQAKKHWNQFRRAAAASH